MSKGTTITRKDGTKGFFPSEIIPLLEQAKRTYRIDANGMCEGGMVLTSTFVSYCDIDKMRDLMRASGQEYNLDAAGYANRYNRLFEIDF